MGRHRLAISGIAITVLVLATSYFGLREWLANESAEEPQSRLFEFTAVPLRPGDEPPVFKATQNDRVTFAIRADRSGEIHVHGYERKVALTPGGVVTLSLAATHAGLFALHLHDPDGRMHGLATLAVRPR